MKSVLQSIPSPPAEPVHALIEKAREAQPAWAATPLRHRLAVLRTLRQAIAADGGKSIAATAALVRQKTAAEILSSEVLPLLDACRFLEREARAILAEKFPPISRRPFWLIGAAARIRRDPRGLILVIAPSNYPLFLPGVQILQALAAGNAVLIKPAPGCTAPILALADSLRAANLPQHLLTILPEEEDTAANAINLGIDKVVLTGSADTGRAILALCAEKLTPAAMELSGCDAVFVRHDADTSLVAQAIHFGLRLNDGRTCLAPRRIFVHQKVAAPLTRALQSLQISPAPVPARQPLIDALENALASGAQTVLGEIHPDRQSVSAPLILTSVPPDSPLLREDFFAPVASLIPVDNDEEALDLDATCPYALASSVFGRDLHAASALAEKINAGCVSVNDLIAPTVDPRLPWTGRGHSGFGSSRAAEGLLEMTVPKAISSRASKPSRQHFKPLTPDHESLFSNYITLTHGRGLHKRANALTALFHTLKLISRREKDKETKP